MFGIGAGELVIILIAGLIIFGPGKLPEIGRAIGKGLREFRKAQAAFSATLDEVSLESDKKDTSTTAEKNSSTEKVSLEKKAVEKIPEEKISVNEQPPHSALTVDDVINLAKQNPISKENVNEKNLNGSADNPTPADTDAGNADSRSNSNGTEKQPRSATN